ncbi:SDR family oxidoreductase [Streptomyces sp. NPDC059009]|uniref:SDR family oxidoreductase n=1 Tax=Streptomyces sp. NPDC059009 TaxID=3346694 RepID=UPI00367EE747
MQTQPGLRSRTGAGTGDLGGRVAVITGASGGIGAATACRLAAEGATVVLVARRGEVIEESARALRGAGRSALAVTADVTSADGLARAVDVITEQAGAPDLLVNNAGVMYPGPLHEMRLDEWRRMLDVNVLGLLQTTGAFLRPLLASARAGRQVDVVNVSSIAGTRDFSPEYAVYNASKAAVSAVSRSLRGELGPQGIRVTDIQPGLVSTGLGEQTTRTESRESIAGLFERHQALEPDELADVIAYVVSRPPHVGMPQLVVAPVTQ